MPGQKLISLTKGMLCAAGMAPIFLHMVCEQNACLGFWYFQSM